MNEPAEPPAAILLVDDRLDALLALESILEAPHLEIVKATSGTEALRALLDRNFAVVVLDVMMPGMDGFELARTIRMRQRSCVTPIVFITAMGADTKLLPRAYAHGAVDYLTKPVDPDMLRAKIAVFVELFQKDRQLRAQSRALFEAERRNRELEVEQLRHAGERRYRHLADAIPQIVWTTDATGRATFFSRRWTEHTGLAWEESSSWLDAVHPAERTECRRRWEEALATGRTFELECRLRGEDGSSRFFLCRALPETGPDGEIAGWLGTHTDLDEIVRARARNAELFERASEAIRLRDEFLSIAAHELRTPLTALVLHLASLEQACAAASESAEQRARFRKKTAAALRVTKRLTALIDELLDVSSLSRRSVPLRPEECDLVALACDVNERFEEQARQIGSNLRVHAAGTVIGHWDRLKIDRVVTNLLSNAFKYGSGRPVELRVEADDEHAYVSVKDEGIGVAPEDRARIFKRFGRAVSADHYGGLGLGLYLASQIAAAHGGSIRVESELGKGSTFTLELPRNARAAEPTYPLEAKA